MDLHRLSTMRAVIAPKTTNPTCYQRTNRAFIHIPTLAGHALTLPRAHHLATLTFPAPNSTLPQPNPSSSLNRRHDERAWISDVEITNANVAYLLANALVTTPKIGVIVKLASPPSPKRAKNASVPSLQSLLVRPTASARKIEVSTFQPIARLREGQLSSARISTPFGDHLHLPSHRNSRLRLLHLQSRSLRLT